MGGVDCDPSASSGGSSGDIDPGAIHPSRRSHPPELAAAARRRHYYCAGEEEGGDGEYTLASSVDLASSSASTARAENTARAACRGDDDDADDDPAPVVVVAHLPSALRNYGRGGGGRGPSSSSSSSPSSSFGHGGAIRALSECVAVPRMKKSRLAAGAVVFLVASVLAGIVGMPGPSAGGGVDDAARGGAKVSRHLGDAAAHDDAAETAVAVAASDFLDDFHERRRRRAADTPDGTAAVFDEPAHARMCRVIIERLDRYDMGMMNFPKIVLAESEYVCRDPDAPHASVLGMFAAQLLHEANNLLGLNVEYTHRCARWERFCTGNLTTVQFHLPDPLSTNAHAHQPGCMDTSASLRAVCSGCLSGDDPTDPNCVLFPSGGYLDAQADNACDMGCHFRQVLPWIRNNLRIVARDWLDTVETRALTFWLRNAAEFGHREKDDMEVSVIALSCKNDGCDMSMPSCACDFDPLPNWVYAMHVPRSSTNVAIIVSPTCARFGTGCTLHAQELYHFLHRLYPRSDVTYNVITSTSSWYMRMITADHLVCPPGDGCLLPAIARDAYTYVYETTSPSVSTWLTCAPADYVNRLTIPIFPPEFVQGDCRHLRARVGSWTGDATLAASMQYSNAVDGYLGCADENFVATPDLPHRRPTTYRWDESIWATCPINLANKGILCNQMNRIGLERILFVGDHTTMTQAISLASILGQNDDISLDPNVVPNFSKTISCEPGSNSTFELAYVRNDRLEEPAGADASPSPRSPNCGPDGEQHCYPWSADYSSGIGKTLLIVNTGYHWGDDWAGYIANFQNFVGKIDEVATANPVRANDVVMFRTSVPGHKECHLHDGVYGNYDEYCPRIVNGAFWHWWGELPPYNDYAIRIINEWNLLNTVKNGPDIELLDPWMMTVLRPDGHLSGPDAGPECAMDPMECMLYSLPGPVDWWNHLLLAQLRDIGTHLENSNPMQAWR